MEKLTRPLGLVLIVSLLTWLSPANSARASNEVFLSNDTAQSEVTYVIQFDTAVKGNIYKIRVALPPSTNAANAALGRLMIGETSIAGSVALSDPDTLIVDLGGGQNIKVGTRILLELFNLNNPPAGSYAIDVRTLDRNGNVQEVIPPIAFSSFATGTGDITAVNAGTGLSGGGQSGDVTLSVNTNQIQSRVVGICPSGSSIRQIDASGNVVCQTDTNSGGTMTSVGTGTGLTGGPITTAGTISIATSYQLPQACLNGQVAKFDGGGGWTCAADNNSGGTVTAVTASAPLVSSGGTTPNIRLPNVIIGSNSNFNTAIGTTALQSNTDGIQNTASGFGALRFNTTGTQNTASGSFALRFNTTGTQNTASGSGALQSNTDGIQNTGIGVAALGSNTDGIQNTASGFLALQSNTTGNFNTANGAVALRSNTTGGSNTASGWSALQSNDTGGSNTASGAQALQSNDTGNNNTAIGAGADVSAGNLTNATAIGANAKVNASNKIRLGDDNVTLVEAAGYVKGLSGLCIGTDCKTAWPVGTGLPPENVVTSPPGTSYAIVRGTVVEHDGIIEILNGEGFGLGGQDGFYTVHFDQPFLDGPTVTLTMHYQGEPEVKVIALAGWQSDRFSAIIRNALTGQVGCAPLTCSHQWAFIAVGRRSPF